MLFVGLYILAGIFAGICSGLLGLGGGVVVVPMLAYVFAHHPVIPDAIVMHMAIASSLAIMVLTSQASVRAHMRHERITWPVYYRLVPGMMIGTVIGVVGAGLLRTNVLHLVFAVFLIVIAMRMLVGSQPSKSAAQWPGLAIFSVVSLLIGFLSGLLGVGGGILVVPFLVRYVLSMRHAIAVSAVCSLTVAIIGSVSNMLTGFYELNLPPWSIGYIYWPAVLFVALSSMIVAPVAAKWVYQLPVKQLRRIFGGMLLIIGLVMLL